MEPPDVNLSQLERLKLAVEVWKTTIGVQQHFNDLELRIRNYAVTLLVAVLSGTAVALKEGFVISIAGRPVSLASFLLAAGFIGWVAFYFMDRHWYHRLLYGAVAHGTAIEERWKTELPDLALTKAISAQSPMNIATKTDKAILQLVSGGLLALVLWIVLALNELPFAFRPRWVFAICGGCWLIAVVGIYYLIPRDEQNPDAWQIRTTQKMNVFYGVIAALLLFMMWAVNTAVKISTTTPASS